jgi:hypothetical protein
MEARFFMPVQIGPGAHPDSYPMGTGSFLRIKRPGRGVDHPPLSSDEVKERVKLYLSSPSGSSWPVRGWTLPLLIPVFTYRGILLQNVNIQTVIRPLENTLKSKHSCRLTTWLIWISHCVAKATDTNVVKVLVVRIKCSNGCSCQKWV